MNKKLLVLNYFRSRIAHSLAQALEKAKQLFFASFFSVGVKHYHTSKFNAASN